MANLSTAINEVIGSPTATKGFRFYLNHSNTAAPGITAPNQITLNRKVEGPPSPFVDDPTELPGAFIEGIGSFPEARLVESHYECTFQIRLHFVTKVAVNTRPRETAREMVVKLTENIMASNKLGLDFIDSIEWAGLSDTDEISRILPLMLPDYISATSLFVIKAQVTF